MKKVLGGIAALIVVAAAGYFGYVYFVQQAKTEIDEVLPKGALYYSQLSDVEKNVAAFQTSPFAKNLSRIDLVELVRNGNASEEEAAEFEDVLKNVQATAANPLFKKFFGEEIGIAIYTFKTLEPLADLNEVLSSVVVVTRLRPDAKTLEFFSQFAGQWGDAIETRSEDYKDTKINYVKFTKSDIEIAYVVIDDLALLSPGAGQLKIAVDVAAKEAKSLADDPKYTELKSQMYPDTLGTLYFDMEGFMANIKALMGAGDPQISAKVEESFRPMTGFKAYALSLVKDDLLKMRVHMSYDETKLSPEVKMFYSCPPSENKTLKFVPRDVFGYGWSNCYDFPAYWAQIKKQMEEARAAGGDDPQVMIMNVERNLGVSIEGDLLPVLGKELGGYLSDIDLNGMFPLPKLVFFIKVNNEANAKALLARLTANPFMLMKSETKEGVAINYFTLPIGGNFEPGYCVLNDYLLVSTSRQLLGESIAASKDPSKSIVASEDFKSVDFGLTDTTNSVSYTRLSEFTKRLRGVSAWMTDWAEAKSAQAEAFVDGSRLKLERLQAEIAQKTAELETATAALNAPAHVSEATDPNAATPPDAGPFVETPAERVASLKRQLEVLKAQEPELQDTIAMYDRDNSKTAMYDYAMKEVLTPVFDAFETVRAMSSRMIYKKDTIESELYIKNK